MSPSMFARVDDVKFQNGFAPGTRNMLVRPNGTATRRPGTRHDNRVKDSSKLARLIPFTYSVDQTYQIELGPLYFRWHRFGVPLRYATPRTVASVDTVGNTLKFTEPHGFPDGGAQVQLINSSGVEADLPGALVTTVTYTATVVDAKTVSLGVAIADAGSNTTYVYLDSEIPKDWFTSRNFLEAAVDVPGNIIDLATAHNFATADPVRFTSSGTLPAPLLINTTYYVIVNTASTIKVALTAALAGAGTAIDLTDDGSAGAVHVIHRRYSVGDLAYWPGAGHGVFYCRADVSDNTTPPSDATHWYLMPREGIYEIPHLYTEAQLAAVGYDQSNDVITLTHRELTPGVAELRRYSDLRWIFTTITFAPDLLPPTIVSVVATFGVYQEFDGDNAADTIFTAEPAVHPPAHALLTGDSVYVEGDAGIGLADSFGPGPLGVPYPAGFYEVSHVGAPAAGVAPIDLKLKTIANGVALTLVNDHVFIRRASPLTDTIQSYRVTAVTAEGLESQSNNGTQVTNNLTVPGSSNLITWTANAVQPSRYHVYRKLKGVYGFIGKVDGDQISGGQLSFKDDNLPADMSHTLPILDTSLGVSAGDSPAAVTHFDQRRFFAGTTNVPHGVWATRVFTETDLSYHIPALADDRLRFRAASKEAISIRHLVPLQRLVILCNSTEIQVVPVNSEVLSPGTIEVRATSYEGSSIVRPAVMASNILFASNRGGHVFELSEGPGGALTKPGDLCLRSEHLFDGETILDQFAAKAPHDIDWLCSSSGLLLGLTYVPQEQVGAWHAHGTGASGFFESVCATAEGDEDGVYAIVKRTIGGSTVRSVERFGEQLYGDLENAYFVDAGATFDGRNTSATATMTLSGGVFWTAGETVTITCNEIRFVIGSDDVGDQIAVRASQAGAWYRVRITAVLTNKTATGVLLQTIPTTLRNVATLLWAFARDTVKLPWIIGETVQVLADGIVQGEKVVGAGGVTTLDTPAIIAHVGLGMPSPLLTLPVGLQIAEAFGQGREKNVNKAFLRVVASGAFEIGPNDTDLVPANTDAVPGTVQTGEIDTTIMPEWSPGAEIVIVQNDPLPLTVLGMVLEISLGGG
jgi:hypothetical protein